MDQAVTDISRRFEALFGSPPAVIARAPGRVEVLGNHTDYNEGYVLSAAIDRYTYAALSFGDGTGRMRFSSTSFPDVVRLDETIVQPGHAWVNYPLGVTAMLRGAGHAVGGFNLLLHGTVPLGAGLSSSASLETAACMGLSRLFGLTVTPEEMARLCQRAEHEFAGTKCGLLDQYSSLFGRQGHLLFIDFRTLEHRAVALPGSDFVMAVTGSGVAHTLAASAYNDRRAECSEAAGVFSREDPSVKTLRDIDSQRLISARERIAPTAFRRARHVVGEDERVHAGMQLLQSGDLDGFGRLLFQSHESSRVNFENSCAELDALVEVAKSIDGVYGARLTGGGFGGATLTLLRRGHEASFQEVIAREYHRRTGHNAAVHIVTAADGACVL